MKHGDKAKAKTAKVSSKTSVRKTSKTGGGPLQSKAAKATKSGKTVKTVKSGKAGKAVKASPRPAPAKASASRSGGRPKAGGNGRSGFDAVAFSNPAVAVAFKRAVKKYPNAFRRLTD